MATKNDVFNLTCPVCNRSHTKTATRHCLPDRFDWCDACENPLQVRIYRDDKSKVTILICDPHTPGKVHAFYHSGQWRANQAITEKKLDDITSGDFFYKDGRDSLAADTGYHNLLLRAFSQLYPILIQQCLDNHVIDDAGEFAGLSEATAVLTMFSRLYD